MDPPTLPFLTRGTTRGPTDSSLGPTGPDERAGLPAANRIHRASSRIGLTSLTLYASPTVTLPFRSPAWTLPDSMSPW